jgi:hypothetical protein
MTRFPKGHIVKYEPTAKGVRRAERLMAENPFHTAPVPKAAHHVELLRDFVFHPACIAHKAERVTGS